MFRRRLFQIPFLGKKPRSKLESERGGIRDLKVTRQSQGIKERQGRKVYLVMGVLFPEA